MPGIRLSAAVGAKIIESITRRYQVPAVPSRRKKEEEEKKEEEKKERRKERRRKEIIFFAAFFSYLDQLVL
jgi:ribosomal protein L12E/L44/L45/RPP1/RPP2